MLHFLTENARYSGVFIFGLGFMGVITLKLKAHVEDVLFAIIPIAIVAALFKSGTTEEYIASITTLGGCVSGCAIGWLIRAVKQKRQELRELGITPTGNYEHDMRQLALRRPGHMPGCEVNNFADGERGHG